MADAETPLSVLSTILDTVTTLLNDWQEISSLVDFVTGQQDPTQQLIDELASVSAELQKGFADIIAELQEQQAAAEWQPYASLVISVNAFINNYSIDFTTINTTTLTVNTEAGQVTLDAWSWDTATHAAALLEQLYDACVSGSSQIYVNGLFDVWVDLIAATQRAPGSALGTDTVYLMSNNLLSDLLCAAFNVVAIHEYCLKIRQTAGFTLTGTDSYAGGETVTLISMRGDPATLNRLGQVSGPSNSIMGAFDAAMRGEVETSSVNGVYIVGLNDPALIPDAQKVQMSSLGDSLFFLGTYELTAEDLANGVIISGLRWRWIGIPIDGQPGSAIPVVYVEVNRSRIGANLSIAPDPVAWAAPTLPSSINKTTPSVAGFGEVWYTFLSNIAGGMVPVPSSDTYIENLVPVITGFGTARNSNRTLYLQVKQAFLDVSNPSKPVYASNAPTWSDSASSTVLYPVPLLPARMTDLYMDLSDVVTTDPWPIVTAGFGGSATLIQFMGATNWPIYRMQVLQPARRLAAQ